MKNIKNYESFGSFEAWMKRIFVNHAINFYRYNKANLHISTSDVDIPYEDEDNDEYIDNYTNTEILKAIQKLPNQQRVVFNLIDARISVLLSLVHLASTSTPRFALPPD